LRFVPATRGERVCPQVHLGYGGPGGGSVESAGDLPAKDIPAGAHPVNEDRCGGDPEQLVLVGLAMKAGDRRVQGGQQGQRFVGRVTLESRL
jgi:hypothetical protein